MEIGIVAPGFPNKTKHYLYVCPGCPHDTYSDKYGDYQRQCFIKYQNIVTTRLTSITKA
jgi:hypothetical protein